MLKIQSIIKFKYIIPIVLLVTILALTIEVIGLFKHTDNVIIEIESGSTLNDICEVLKVNSVINSKLLFKVIAYKDSSDFKAGTHTFNSSNYFSIKRELLSTPVAIGIKVTIPEGYEQREIGLLLQEKGICSYDEFNNAAKIDNFKNYWFLNSIEKREYELEGYLFPDTYFFKKNDKAIDVINAMLSNFDSKISEDMRKRADNLNKSFDEIITMASIIEREAAAKNEYDVVSGVFYNRLDNETEASGFLQSCATVQYILNERKSVLSTADTMIDSPYNTYKYKGLPIGPIASPGIDTINAALYPKKTDYLYFVADGNGKHYFAKTYDEHQINMRKAGY